MQLNNGSMGRGHHPRPGPARGVCFDLPREVEEDARDTGQVEGGAEGHDTPALSQRAAGGPRLPGVCHLNLPSHGPVPEGVPPDSRDAERRSGCRGLEGEGI
jgi:hypothetical protein